MIKSLIHQNNQQQLIALLNCLFIFRLVRRSCLLAFVRQEKQELVNLCKGLFAELGPFGVLLNSEQINHKLALYFKLVDPQAHFFSLNCVCNRMKKFDGDFKDFGLGVLITVQIKEQDLVFDQPSRYFQEIGKGCFRYFSCVLLEVAGAGLFFMGSGKFYNYLPVLQVLPNEQVDGPQITEQDPDGSLEGTSIQANTLFHECFQDNLMAAVRFKVEEMDEGVSGQLLEVASLPLYDFLPFCYHFLVLALDKKCATLKISALRVLQKLAKQASIFINMEPEFQNIIKFSAQPTNTLSYPQSYIIRTVIETKLNLMEQQLQAEIKKNKNLLQSNFTLMEQNELCITALTELKTFMLPYLFQEDWEQSICADDAHTLVNAVIAKIKELATQKQYSRQDATEEKGSKNQVKKQCECEKWKSMYTNQSEESLRLSKKIVELEQKTSQIEAKHELQLKEMDVLLKQYLILFQRVNSVDFMQAEASNKRNKQTVKENKNQNMKVSKQKQKRVSSKSKNQSKSHMKKSSKGDQEKTGPQIPSKVLEQLPQFPAFLSYLENLRRDLSDCVLQNKLLREEICEAETLVRIYREKERERILYNRLILD